MKCPSCKTNIKLGANSATGVLSQHQGKKACLAAQKKAKKDAALAKERANAARTTSAMKSFFAKKNDTKPEQGSSKDSGRIMAILDEQPSSSIIGSGGSSVALTSGSTSTASSTDQATTSTATLVNGCVKDCIPVVWMLIGRRREHTLAESVPADRPIPNAAPSVSASQIQTATAATASSNPTESFSELVTRLRACTARLPSSVPEAVTADTLAALSVDPAQCVDAEDEDGAWKGVNTILHRVFQSDSRSRGRAELALLIRRGALGMDGACAFFERAARLLGDGGAALDAHLERLLRAVETL